MGDNTNMLACTLHFNISSPDYEGRSMSNWYRMDVKDMPCNNTAVVISDMWDKHWCKGATKRVAELAPIINDAITKLRNGGVTIVHCPSDTENFYKDHKAFKRTNDIEKRYWPQDSRWTYTYENEIIPKITNIADPNGLECDCGSEKCKRGQPWKRQNEAIKIDEDKDYICMDNDKIYDVLRNNRIRYVLMMGVHTNMCILNRHFGIKKLLLNEIQPILVKDLTDGMLPRERKPFKDHFSALDDVFTYIETYYCPTTTSAAICINQSEGATIDLRSERFRFSEDKRVCQKKGKWNTLTKCRQDFDQHNTYQHKKYGLPSRIAFKIDDETLISDLLVCYDNNKNIIDACSGKDTLGNWYTIDIPFGEYITEIEGRSVIRNIGGYRERVIAELTMFTNKGTKGSITTNIDQTSGAETFSIKAPDKHALVALFGSFWEPDARTPKYALDTIGFFTQEVYPLQITIDGKTEYNMAINILDSTDKAYKVMFFDQRYYWKEKSGTKILCYKRIDCQDHDGNKMYVRFFEDGFAFYDEEDNEVGKDTALNCKNWDNNKQIVKRCFNY